MHHESEKFKVKVVKRNLSPILADIVTDLEVHCLQNLDFEIPVFYRYVDDIFAIIPKTKLNQILKIFNDYYPV